MKQLHLRVLSALGLSACAILLAGGCSRNVASVAETPVEQNSVTHTSTNAPANSNSSDQEPAKPIQWQPSYDAALKQARESQKPIMIDFYADWCPPCKYLDSEIYTAPEVKSEAENFVSLKVDTDKSIELSRQYQITGLPTIVFLDSSGREVHRTSGIDGRVDSFVHLMQEARAKAAPTPA